MSNFNPVRINPSRNPGNSAMQFARKALLDKLQEPGTPTLGKQAPLVPLVPPNYGGEGVKGTQPLQTLQNLGKHGSRSR